MAELTYAQALNQALRQAMESDPSVFLIGEDIGVYGGAFGVSAGLIDIFGSERVIDTPISEAGIAGAILGAAMTGMRPVGEIQFMDFITLSMEQLVLQASKVRFMFGGKASVPFVLRTPGGSGTGAAAQHSESLENWFVHVPGLKVVMPSSAYDAKGLLLAAIDDDNPVIFVEHKLLYKTKGDVPQAPYRVPLGKTNLVCAGRHVTVVATSIMVQRALQAADRLAEEGIELEVLDPRTLKPLDDAPIIQSVKKTGRALVVHEAPETGGFGGEVVARIAASEAFGYLEAPIRRLAGLDIPIPYNRELERRAVPQVEDIIAEARRLAKTEYLSGASGAIMPVEVIIPKFGFTLETSEIVHWLKREGDAVTAGEPICEVTTDKINMEVEAPASGTLYKILHGAGEVVEVTTVIAYVLRAGEQSPETLPDISATPVARRLAESHNIDLSGIQGTGSGNRILRQDVERAMVQETDKVNATPAARRIAGEANLDLRAIHGSGPHGRIQGADVQNFIERQPTSPTPILPTATGMTVDDASAVGEHEIVKLQGMRRTIAARLQQSYQNIPHFFVEVEVDASAIEALRRRMKAREHALSVTAIVIKACAGALKRHRWINATLVNDEISLWSNANIGVAVALEQGLIVPVIHQAQRRSLQEIQELLSLYTRKARDNALTREDVTGGTFTISNMGMFGVKRFSAIINPPQVAILAVGSTAQKFLPDNTGNPVLRSTMSLVLSADHRVIDGAQAARFLDDLRMVLEDPALLAW